MAKTQDQDKHTSLEHCKLTCLGVAVPVPVGVRTDSSPSFEGPRSPLSPGQVPMHLTRFYIFFILELTFKDIIYVVVWATVSMIPRIHLAEAFWP